MSKNPIRKPKFSRVFAKALLISLAISLALCVLMTVALNSILRRNLDKNQRNVLDLLRHQIQIVFSDSDLTSNEIFALSDTVGQSVPMTGRDMMLLVDNVVIGTNALEVDESSSDEVRYNIESDITIIGEEGNYRFRVDNGTYDNYPDRVLLSQVIPFSNSVMPVARAGFHSSVIAFYEDNYDGDIIYTMQEGEIVETGTFFDDAFIPHTYTVKLGPNTRVTSIFANTGSGMFVLYGMITAVCILIALAFSAVSYNRSKNIYEAFVYRNNLTNMLAHDLKTPLMAISSYAENYEASSDSDKKDYYVGRISENAAYMNSLVSNALALSKAEKDLPLASDEIVLETVVDDVLEQLSSAINSKKIKINKSGLNDVKLTSDELCFKASVVAILENSVKFAPVGSEIKISSSDSALLTVVNKFEGEIDNIDKIKEPFVRGNSERGDSDGSGLGLAIADTNLSKFGYDLKIDIKDDRFTASINI